MIDRLMNPAPKLLKAITQQIDHIRKNRSMLIHHRVNNINVGEWHETRDSVSQLNLQTPMENVKRLLAHSASQRSKLLNSFMFSKSSKSLPCRLRLLPYPLD
jgi:hypothetical protein